MATSDYDPRVRNLADLGRRHGRVTDPAIELRVKGSDYVLPPHCACCADTAGLRTVTRHLVADSGGLPFGRHVHGAVSVRFPLCLNCQFALDEVRTVAAEAERLLRQEHPLTMVQSVVVGLAFCAGPALALLGLWDTMLLTFAATLVVCLVLYRAIAMSKRHLEARIVRRVENRLSRGWQVPVLANYPGTTFNWKPGRDATDPPADVRIGLVVYNRCFADAFVAANGDVMG